MTEISNAGMAIVIEGQGGAGKTTAAQLLAESHGLSNFNTGTLFRATAAAMLYEQVQLGEISDFVTSTDYDIDTSDSSRPLVAAGGLDVSDILQAPEVTRVASCIGGVADASAKLEHLFNKQLAGNSMVVEGKHLANRMGKAATHMFFFMADFQTRAFRKWRQSQELGRTYYTLAEAYSDTMANDARDRRLLVVPEKTEVIDTTLLTPRQVVDAISKYANLG